MRQRASPGPHSHLVVEVTDCAVARPPHMCRAPVSMQTLALPSHNVARAYEVMLAQDLVGGSKKRHRKGFTGHGASEGTQVDTMSGVQLQVALTSHKVQQQAARVAKLSQRVRQTGNVFSKHNTSCFPQSIVALCARCRYVHSSRTRLYTMLGSFVKMTSSVTLAT